MKVYWQGIRDNKEILGSFGVCILDARKSRDNLINDGFELYHKNLKIDSLTGFRIVKSNRFIDTDIDASKTIYEFKG